MPDCRITNDPFEVIVSDIVLRAATVIDGTGADPLHEAEIVLRDGKIARVGARDSNVGDVRTIDYGEATIMPGLIDCHCHHHTRDPQCCIE